jgi:hypothetical protein
MESITYEDYNKLVDEINNYIYSQYIIIDNYDYEIQKKIKLNTFSYDDLHIEYSYLSHLYDKIKITYEDYNNLIDKINNSEYDYFIPKKIKQNTYNYNNLHIEYSYLIHLYGKMKKRILLGNY